MKTTRRNMSMITLIIGRHRAQQVLQKLFDAGLPHAMLSSARGTLIQDKWYQSLLPMISPELAMIHMAVPDPSVDWVMEQAVAHAQLQHSGAGSIYSKPCDDLHVTGDFPLWPIERDETPQQNASSDLQENLTAIYFISQGEHTAAVCRAAMGVGSHGPVVQYSSGYGLRDRLGWLRITSKPIKEVVSVLVDNVDADLVFAAMCQAGQVDRPARGLIYRMPVQKGLINIDSVYSETRHAASVQQIIRAIDDIKGNKDWRRQDLIAAKGGAAAGLDFIDTLPAPASDEDLCLLSVMVDRNHAREISLKMVELGAPGANIDYMQLHDPEQSRQHREIANVKCVLNRADAAEIEHQIVRLELDMMLYLQPVTRFLTYSPPPSVAPKRRYRGAPLA